MLLQLLDWIDEIFSKLTRTWMYLLEMAGMVFIFYRIKVHDLAAEKIFLATNMSGVAKAQAYYEAVKDTTLIITPFLLIICVVLPAVIGTLRTVRKKWSLKTPIGEIEQEFETETKEEEYENKQ